MKTYGLIGRSIGYSFSRKFFSDKFEKEGKNDHRYINFDFQSIDEFPAALKADPSIAGLNCTIPYKQEIMPFLDEIDDEAAAVGAVNTIKLISTSEGVKLKGYNTDVIGFENALKPLLASHHKKALILGTGGASKAIKYILSKLGLDYVSASIEKQLFEKELRYESIDQHLLEACLVVINATPLGTFPNVDSCPDIPYEFLTPDHVLFDLVYNPEVTRFMSYGNKIGATTKNGYDMLVGQAIASWEIWNR